MAKTLVGVYDTLTDAERIVQELVEYGFSRSDILLASHQANGRPSADIYVGEWVSAAASGDVIERLMERGVSTPEARAYAFGIRPGGVLVLLEASDSLADRGLEIMNRMQPVAMDDRAARWRQEGRTGVNANTAPYTSSEIRSNPDPNTGPYTAARKHAYATEEYVVATVASEHADVATDA